MSMEDLKAKNDEKNSPEKTTWPKHEKPASRQDQPPAKRARAGDQAEPAEPEKKHVETDPDQEDTFLETQVLGPDDPGATPAAEPSGDDDLDDEPQRGHEQPQGGHEQPQCGHEDDEEEPATYEPEDSVVVVVVVVVVMVMVVVVVVATLPRLKRAHVP